MGLLKATVDAFFTKTPNGCMHRDRQARFGPVTKWLLKNIIELTFFFNSKKKNIDRKNV